MNFQRGQEKEPLEINLVPMIDVMLVILIFLMISTTYSKYTELQISLPTAEAAKQPERPSEITVLINAQGQYVVNRAAVNFQRGREEEPLEINLVPLIDVMMVILIFLMITTTYSKYTELQITLPTADAEKQPERPREIAVLVNAQGQYVVNKQAVAFRSVEQLADELRRAGGGAKEPVVVITADAAATHQAVVRVMEAARIAGLSQITFTTQATK